MPNIQPFKAIRYAAGTDLSSVTAPPYDVITPEMREALQRRDPENIIHLTLGPVLPGDTDERYARAGFTFRKWLAGGVLVEDLEESFFLYRFDPERDPPSAGIICTLELESLGEASILAHERTMPGPKADRLALTRETQANLEPIWLVSAQPMNLVSNLHESVKGQEPLADVSDEESVRHRLWRIPASLESSVQKAVQQVTLVVADGHHRYETLVAYRDEQRIIYGAGGPWDFTLTLLQDPRDLGPSLNPIHRVVADIESEALAKRLSLNPFSGDIPDLAAEVASLGPGTIGVVTEQGLFTVATEADLDTAWLDDLLKELGAHPTYEHRVTEIEQATSRGAIGFWLAPIAIETVTSRALSGKVMPPKTTLFRPKPLSGLVLRGLRQ